uniref:Uncharacterized protein n=1 Tax=Amphimedon queenslandica TaxID=400682 RepID=A0A1X7TFJ5_AMPQE
GVTWGHAANATGALVMHQMQCLAQAVPALGLTI